MEKIWTEMYEAAKAVLNERRISEYVTCGEVAAAICSKSGRIYTGVCVDTCSTLGICAERNAIFNMITNGEQEIDKVLCILPDGSTESGIDKAFWLSDSWFAPQEQYLSIYHRVEEGTIANAWVYNLQGVPVYRLYNNTLLAAVGSTYWDGRDDAGEPCSVGIYMVVIEYITLSGKVNGVKIPVALGT